ncbi:MAG TPA: ATP-binding protein, partial [Gemmataceae bacterium]|nr:ATP-binding protein [Gemmataceae bacterium]
VVCDAAGEPLYLLGACADVTERKGMEEALRRARDDLEKRVEERTAELRGAQERALRSERLAAIGTTAAGLAHEGRNALQATLACVERLRWRLQGQSEVLALLGEIEKSQDALARLFEDVRDFAAPVQIHRAPCDLSAVWREAWSQALALHPGCDAVLTGEPGGVDLHCDADAFRLVQVFRNVFDNSLAACPSPARVAVACAEAARPEGPAVALSVRDNGPGLSKEQRRRIFDPFFTTKTKGTGLGMAIAKRVIEAHGGEIAVGAGGPGAEILLTLPRRSA